jgi:hypothetical protein
MIVRQCTHEGRTVLTIGTVCIHHGPPLSETFPRGRPFVAPSLRHAADRRAAVATAVRGTDARPA